MRLHNSKKDILNGNIVEQIILFSIPSILAYLLQQVNNVADSLILGKMVGAEALAAVGGSAKSVNDTILNFISGMAAGVTVVVAQHYGRGQREKVKDAVKTGMFICFVFGGAFSILCSLLAKPVVVLMKTPPEVIQGTLTYLYFYCASYIPYMVYQVGLGVLRATGDTRTPFILVGIQAIAKIIFDVLLVGIFKLEILGAGIANLLSNIVVGVVVLYIFAKTDNSYEFNIKEFGFEKDALQHILKFGIPSGIQASVFAMSCAVAQAKVNGYGTNAVAAYSAYNTIDNIYWSFTNAIGTALITLFGQNHGAKKHDRVKKILKEAIIIELIVAIAIGALVYIFSRQLLGIFLDSELVLSIGVSMMHTAVCFYWPYAFVETLSALFKSTGHAIKSMIVVIVGCFVFRIGYLFIYPFASVNDVIRVFPLSWALTAILFIGMYFLKVRNLTQDN